MHSHTIIFSHNSHSRTMNSQADMKNELLAAMTQLLESRLSQFASAKQVQSQQSQGFTTPDVQISGRSLSRQSSGGSTLPDEPISARSLARHSSGVSTSSFRSSGGSTLSRHSSGFSTMSDVNYEESQCQDDDANGEVLEVAPKEWYPQILDDPPKRKRRRRRKTKQDPELDAVVKIIRAPVLEKVDAKFLAPRISPMFYRMPKKKKNADGTRNLKMYPDMDREVFKEQVNPIIRNILGETGMRNRNKLNLYLVAALKVVSKRRANHVQAWRLKNKHSNLKYGSGVDFSDREQKKHLEIPRSRHTVRRKLKPDHLSGSETEEEPAPANVDKPVDKNADKPVDKNADKPVVDKAVEAKVSRGNKSKHPPCSISKVTTTCTVCKKIFTFNSGLDWNKEKRPVRCDSCFNKHVQDKLVPLVHENRPSGEKVREKALRERDENGNLKKIKRTSCKHCGSTDHFTRASKKCPYYKGRKSNGKGKNADVPAPVAPAKNSTQQPDARASKKRKRKRKSNAKGKKSRVQNVPVESPGVPAPVDPSKDSTQQPAETSLDAPTDAQPAFAVGDNCLARWEGRFFRAQVTGIQGDRYSVYFPADGKTKDNLKKKDVKHDDQKSLRRRDLMNKVWFYKGDAEVPKGYWKVRRIVENAYVCTRLSGAGRGIKKNIEHFDIGHVMRRYTKELEKERIYGPRYQPLYR